MSLRGTVLPAIMVLLGIAIIVRTLTGGGGPLTIGILLGVLFCAAGGLRLYVEHRGRPA